MRLVYLRFDEQGVVRTYHIHTGSRADVNAILALAEFSLLSARRICTAMARCRYASALIATIRV